MSNFNKALLLGRVGQEPELKNLPSGQSVLNLSVATNEHWLKDGTKQEKTTWHNVTVFGKQAENCQKYLGKGSQVMVEGKISNRTWEDKNGVKRYQTDIVANNVQFISTNREQNEALKNMHNETETKEVNSNANFASDDIPF